MSSYTDEAVSGLDCPVQSSGMPLLLLEHSTLLALHALSLGRLWKRKQVCSPGYNYQDGERPDLAAVCGHSAAGRGTCLWWAASGWLK